MCTRIVKYRRDGLESPSSNLDDSAEPSVWDVEIRTESRMNGDETRFLVSNRLEAFDGGKLFRTRETQAEIPRDLN